MSKHDLGVFPGSAASRQTRSPDFTAKGAIALAIIILTITYYAARSVAPLVV